MLQEALQYFRNEKGFDSLFSLFKKKYESLGRFGGTVKIASFTDEELVGIARFFGLTVYDIRAKGKISLLAFEEQLKQTKFSQINLKELLEAYFQTSIISNREIKELQMKKQGELLLHIKEKYPSLAFWIAHIKEKTPDTYWIYRLMDNSPENFEKMMRKVHDAFIGRPTDFERLPIFSQRITRNPHALDLDKNTGRLFIHLLAVDYAKGNDIVVPADSEGINDLLFHYNILRDDITNYVTCANLLAETDDGIHPMWYEAAKAYSVLNIPLRELLKVKTVYAANRQKQIWIVENSGVYSSILDKIPHIPIICTHGQFKLASLYLMDMLVKAGCTLYYASDIDPEGIGMAERLLLRYRENAKLWKMDISDYEASLSNVKLSNERLAKLNNITIPALIKLAEALLEQRKAGYQEALLDEMISELESVIEKN